MTDEIPLSSEDSQHFFSLIHMLQRSALLHMGGIPDTEGKIHFNMGEAKQAIDLLDILTKRTAGNLEKIEENMLKGIVSELKMRFVGAPADQERIKAEQKRQEDLQQTFEKPDKATSDTLIDDDEE
jgi:hypothetical protein